MKQVFISSWEKHIHHQQRLSLLLSFASCAIISFAAFFNYAQDDYGMTYIFLCILSPIICFTSLCTLIHDPVADRYKRQYGIIAAIVASFYSIYVWVEGKRFYDANVVRYLSSKSEELSYNLRNLYLELHTSNVLRIANKSINSLITYRGDQKICRFFRISKKRTMWSNKYSKIFVFNSILRQIPLENFGAQQFYFTLRMEMVDIPALESSNLEALYMLYPS